MAFIPAYMRVRQYCVDLALRHTEAETRIMSEREICRKLQVSRTTTRKALKDLIVEGWLEVKPGRGMFVHSPGNLPGGTGKQTFHRVMLVWGDGKHVSLNGLFMDLLARFCDVFKNLPVLLQTAQLVGTRDQMVEEIEMYRPDGLLWVRPLPAHFGVIKKIRRKRPVCMVGNPPCRDPFHVTMDYTEAGRMAAQWFLGRGLSRIAYGGHQAGNGVMEAFFEGWKGAHAMQGKPFNPGLTLERGGNFPAEVQRILGLNIEGLFCYGSEYAAVDRAFDEAGAPAVPRLVDRNFFGTYGAKRPPDGELLFFKPETATTAAEQLFRSLEDPDFKPGETVFHAELAGAPDPGARTAF